MSVIVVGGIERLGQQYRAEGERQGIDIQIFNQDEQNIYSTIKNSDGVVIFTNMISHQARKRAVKAAKNEKIPVLLHHSCGLCSLRECLNCLEIIGKCGVHHEKKRRKA